jgi:hypothetical protein
MMERFKDIEPATGGPVKRVTASIESSADRFSVGMKS